VRPADGTLYAEAERSAIRESLYELLDDFPDAKLPELSAEQCLIATGYFVGICIYIRFRLDIGQNIQDRAPND